MSEEKNPTKAEIQEAFIKTGLEFEKRLKVIEEILAPLRELDYGILREQAVLIKGQGVQGYALGNVIEAIVDYLDKREERLIDESMGESLPGKAMKWGIEGVGEAVKLAKERPYEEYRQFKCSNCGVQVRGKKPRRKCPKCKRMALEEL